MIEAARNFLAIGVTIVGLAIVLILQAQVLRCPQSARSVGNLSLGFGIFLGIMGLVVMFLGITFIAS